MTLEFLITKVARLKDRIALPVVIEVNGEEYLTARTCFLDEDEEGNEVFVVSNKEYDNGRDG